MNTSSFRTSSSKTILVSLIAPIIWADQFLADASARSPVSACGSLRKHPRSERGYSWLILFDLSWGVVELAAEAPPEARIQCV